MKKSIRAIVMLAMAALVCAPRPALAQVFKVGTFTKSTGTAPASQTVAHNLGVTPKAIIFWTSGGVSGSLFLGSYSWAFGITDGTTSRSTGTSSQNNKHTAAATRRGAAKALTIVQYGSVLLAEADMQATPWDATNFYLNWTTNNTTGYVINFIAIGGAGVSAKVVDWAATAWGITGNVAVTGVGFQPNVVLNFGDEDSSSLPTPWPGGGGWAPFMLSAMDAGGNQWVTTVYTNGGISPSATARAQRTDACIEETSFSAVEQMRAQFVSMDVDGFTVNFTLNNDGPNRIFSLALAGLNVHAGSFNKSTAAAPASQPVTGIGFQPAAVLLASFEDVTQASPVANNRLGVGAADGTTQGSSGIYDQNGVAPTVTESIQPITQQIFMKVNTSASSTDAQGTLTSLDAGGFTVSWSPNDAVATEFLYLAFAPLSASAVTARIVQSDAGARRNDPPRVAHRV
jgi:hypothetical protein